MATWNDLYESTPRQGYNPGYGAREFQTMKSRISDRISVEHIFGQNETDLTEGYAGAHKEGSARIFVADQGTREADSKVAAIGEIGQLIATMTPITTKQTNEIDSDSSSEANFAAKLSINAELENGTVALETLFDYEGLVNTSYDQNIGGMKEFTLLARVQDHREGGKLELEDINDTFSAFTKVDDARNVLNAGELRELIADSKNWNLFDNTKDYNAPVLHTDGKYYTPHDIHVNSVHAKNVYGAVWG